MKKKKQADKSARNVRPVWSGHRLVQGPWCESDGVGINQRPRSTTAVLLSQPTTYPRIHVSAYANAIMWSIVDQMSVEASWYATAVRGSDGNIYVDDVFIPIQTGSPSLTTITEDGEARLMEELLQEKSGAETIQNLACWGHSHHTMGVFASSQDEFQARELIKRRTDFYVRFIMNKRGDLNATLYLLDEGVEIQNAVCVVEPIDSESLPALYEWVAAELAEKHTVQYDYGVDAEDGADAELDEDGESLGSPWVQSAFAFPHMYAKPAFPLINNTGTFTGKVTSTPLQGADRIDQVVELLGRRTKTQTTTVDGDAHA